MGLQLVDYKAERAAAISANGIRIEDGSGGYRVDVPVGNRGKWALRANAVILCVKSHKTRESMDRAFLPA